MNRKVIILCCASFALIFASCKTAPKAETPAATEPAAPVEEQPATAPAEQPAETPKEEPAPVDNTALIEKADNARDAAIAAGADQLGDAFTATEKKYNDLKAAGNDGTDKSAEIKDVIDRYQALENYAKALTVKNHIDELDVSSYDTDDYNKGEAAIDGLEELFSDGTTSGKDLLDRAGTAYSSYSKVLDVALRKMTKDERTAAIDSKKKADSVKAGVAAKDDYSTAVDELRAGDSGYSMQDFEKAYGHYKTAHESFDTMYESVSEKRAEAQKAIDEAKQRAADSANVAAQADETNPIAGESQEGIEAPDAVLLEPQTYDDPAAAEADVPDTIDDGEAAK